MAAADQESSVEARMNSITETRQFAVQVHHNRANYYRSSSGVDILPIRFKWAKVTVNYNPSIQGYDCEPPDILSRRTLKLRFSRERASGSAKITERRLAKYRRVIARSPTEMDKLQMKLARFLRSPVGIPEDKHPFIIVHILDMIELADPDKIIDVHLMDVTVRATGEFAHLNVEDNYYRLTLIPASEAFIQGLQQVRLVEHDSLEMLGLETSCAVCLDAFADTKEITIARLPCLHYYHHHCIVEWLRINHVCPICRHPNAPIRCPGSSRARRISMLLSDTEICLA
ncbi:uncharacterized protein LOC121052167 [Rosa chinensis]|uniref:uncharacterized protein LOC121052167 n=1 Tax=Rosa chinensis TaxID=74649 RepID=UPI001AD90B2C|nr:uncharacterized protein LOC121052167 [Rosa chinensis]